VIQVCFKMAAHPLSLVRHVMHHKVSFFPHSSILRFRNTHETCLVIKMVARLEEKTCLLSLRQLLRTISNAFSTWLLGFYLLRLHAKPSAVL